MVNIPNPNWSFGVTNTKYCKICGAIMHIIKGKDDELYWWYDHKCPNEDEASHQVMEVMES